MAYAGVSFIKEFANHLHALIADEEEFKINIDKNFKIYSF